jgi:hypothetical protein|nr:MAG TPA: hypothetical protein [Bacteriophage sp.]
MKWYESPLTVQWDNALELLKQGKVEAYTREMRRCNQVICRIRRERARRAKAR